MRGIWVVDGGEMTIRIEKTVAGTSRTVTVIPDDLSPVVDAEGGCKASQAFGGIVDDSEDSFSFDEGSRAAALQVDPNELCNIVETIVFDEGGSGHSRQRSENSRCVHSIVTRCGNWRESEDLAPVV